VNSFLRSGRALSLSANAVAGFAGYLVAILITFFLSPYVIQMLGDARYGVWSLIAELTGYASLLDVGIRGAVSYYVAFYAGQRSDDDIRRTIASAFWTLSALGAFTLLAGLALAAAFPSLFKIGALDPSEVSSSMAILAFMVALTLPFSLLNSILFGFRQQAFAGAADIFARVLAGIACAYALSQGGGLVALSLITLAGRLLTWLIQFGFVRSSPVAPSLRPAWFSRLHLRQLLSYGSKSLFINFATLLVHRMDLIVISAFSGVEFVTIYTIGAMLVTYAFQVVTQLAISYTPYLSNDAGADSNQRLIDRFTDGQRQTNLLAFLLAGGIAAFGPAFLGLWVGERFVQGSWMLRSDVILFILLGAQLPRALQCISIQLLFATRKVTFLMWLSLAEAAANLSLSLVLVRHIGLPGVAFGSLLPSAITQFVVLPWYITRSFGIPARSYLWTSRIPGLQVGAVTAGTGLALVHWLPPGNWPAFFAETALTAAAGVAFAWLAGHLKQDEPAIRRLLRLR
jgi:O-antigen/teichoic acid export membrane protein